MDHDQAMHALHAGELTEAVIAPARDANGWTLIFLTRDGKRCPYTGLGGTAKSFHTLEHATEIAREIGFGDIRVEEEF